MDTQVEDDVDILSRITARVITHVVITPVISSRRASALSPLHLGYGKYTSLVLTSLFHVCQPCYYSLSSTDTGYFRSDGGVSGR